jgi:hypothetical protein
VQDARACSALGAQYLLYAPSNTSLSRREDSLDDWSWEHVLWLGLGQRIRRNAWDPQSSPIPPSIAEMLEYARSKHLKLLAYFGIALVAALAAPAAASPETTGARPTIRRSQHGSPHLASHTR